jgi:hypothetical protein
MLSPSMCQGIVQVRTDWPEADPAEPWPPEGGGTLPLQAAREHSAASTAHCGPCVAHPAPTGGSRALEDAILLMIWRTGRGPWRTRRSYEVVPSAPHTSRLDNNQPTFPQRTSASEWTLPPTTAAGIKHDGVTTLARRLSHPRKRPWLRYCYGFLPGVVIVPERPRDSCELLSSFGGLAPQAHSGAGRSRACHRRHDCPLRGVRAMRGMISRTYTPPTSSVRHDRCARERNA